MLAGSARNIDLARFRYRITQGLSYLRPRRSNMLDARLRQLLGPVEFGLVQRLSSADRAHHLAVYDRLVQMGCADDDVLRAALLHDVGKVDGDARVGLTHRTLAVLLATMPGRLARRKSSPSGSRWMRGLLLTRAHPEVGARLAREAGCGERVCWLIAHHHDRDPDDAGLRLLRRADDGRPK